MLLKVGDSQPVERLDLSNLRVKEVTGDEVIASVTLRENKSVGRTFYNPVTETIDFLMKWTGSGLEIIGYKDGYEMRRTGG